jgi:hypothetical protein
LNIHYQTMFDGRIQIMYKDETKIICLEKNCIVRLLQKIKIKIYIISFLMARYGTTKYLPKTKVCVIFLVLSFIFKTVFEIFLAFLVCFKSVK